MQNIKQRKLINLVDADKWWRKNLLKPNITQQTATPDYKILRKKKSAMTAASMHPLRVAPPYNHNQAYKKGVAKLETPLSMI